MKVLCGMFYLMFIMLLLTLLHCNIMVPTTDAFSFVSITGQRHTRRGQVISSTKQIKYPKQQQQGQNIIKPLKMVSGGGGGGGGGFGGARSIVDLSSTPLSFVESHDQQQHVLLKSTFSTTVLSEATAAWVEPVASVLDPTLNFLSFAMLCRVVISWYPTTNINEIPFNIVSWPTEPLLKMIRGVIPPAFGVDITPIVWFGVFTFLHEILLGQQGLFTMMIKYGM